MMSREEIKEEMKSTEGNPQNKARRRRIRGMSKRRMLADVPKADVVVTNPTHIAIALRYDRKTMQAPRLVAKGIRKNAEEIRELARAARRADHRKQTPGPADVQVRQGRAGDSRAALRGGRRGAGVTCIAPTLTVIMRRRARRRRPNHEI